MLEEGEEGGGGEGEGEGEEEEEEGEGEEDSLLSSLSLFLSQLVLSLLEVIK